MRVQITTAHNLLTRAQRGAELAIYGTLSAMTIGGLHGSVVNPINCGQHGIEPEYLKPIACRIVVEENRNSELANNGWIQGAAESIPFGAGFGFFAGLLRKGKKENNDSPAIEAVNSKLPDNSLPVEEIPIVEAMNQWVEYWYNKNNVD